MMRKVRFALRNILKDKGLNGINIIGLAIGMMAFLLIFHYIVSETSYDRFFTDSDRLNRLVFYRYYQTGLDKSVGNNFFVGQIAFDKIPVIENFCRCKRETQMVQSGEQIYKEERTLFADSTYFDMFSQNVISGNRSDFLSNPGEAIITESTARKYFGDENPLGKIIYGVNPGKNPLTIKGVSVMYRKILI
jgi:putative ABC transport system permease protein